MRKAAAAIVACAAMLGARAVFAATYYVDFDAGKDASNGTAADSAWKHAPGDPAATGVAGATKLAAGDVVKFKGGADYRGNLLCEWSGEKDKPIVYDGNVDGKWGEGQAIVDGSQLLTGWARCASADDCGGNANWKNVWWTYAPAKVTSASANLTEDGQLLFLSEEPKQPDPFFMERIENFYTIPNKDMTKSSIVDAKRLDQTDAHYWDDASVAMWTTPNWIGVRKIASFVPAEHKITYTPDTGEPYRDRPERYALFNSIHLIGRAGEYYFNDRPEPDGRHKVYLWPLNEADLNMKAPAKQRVTVSVRQNGFDLGDGVSYVTIEGFHIELFSGVERNNGIGVRVVNEKKRSTGLIVRNNLINHIGHPFRGYGGIFINGGTDCLAEGNQILDNPGGIGILCGGGDHVTLKNNLVRKPGSQAIWFMGCKNSAIIGNTVEDALGTHANGISVYSGSSNILIDGNRVFNSNIPFTMEKSKGLTITNNVFDGGGKNTVCTSWGHVQDVKVFNNVLIHAGEHVGLQFYKDRGDADIVVRNNIMDGFRGAQNWTEDHNLYIAKEEKQGALQAGDILEPDLAKIFADPEKRDFRLKAGSPAIAAGVDVPVNKDADGKEFPQGKPPDMGAHQTVTTANLAVPAPAKE